VLRKFTRARAKCTRARACADLSDPHIHAIDFIKLDSAAGVLRGECGECGFGVERTLAAPEACESECRCKPAQAECCQRCRTRAVDTGSRLLCSAARPISPGAAHQGEARACRWARYQGTGWVRWKLLQLLPWQTISVSLPPAAGPAATAGDDGPGSAEDMRNAGAIGPSGTKAHVPASSMNAAVPRWSHRAIVARGFANLAHSRPLW
jgi:hypothetical protein